MDRELKKRLRATAKRLRKLGEEFTQTDIVDHINSIEGLPAGPETWDLRTCVSVAASWAAPRRNKTTCGRQSMKGSG
jgi:hypothetical protein